MHEFEIGGILYKLFPYKEFKFAGRFFGYKSKLLNKEIIKYVKEKDCVFHLNGAGSFFNFNIIQIVNQSVPIILQNHGGVPYTLSIDKSNNILNKIYLFLLSKIQRYMLNKITVLFVHSDREKELWQSNT